jgi:hypothetical protein
MRLTLPRVPWSDARARVADLSIFRHEERPMMETTHTTAGQLAHAGAARLRVVAPAAYRTTAPCAAPGVRVHESGQHQSASWTKGAFAIPATTFMVLDAKNRPARPLLEHSP